MKRPLIALMIALVVPASFTSLQAEEKPSSAESKQTVLNVSVEQAETVLSKNKDVIILDVRTPKEYANGHLHSATNLDFYAADFEHKLAKMDRSRPYLVHCAVGGRSAKVRDKMKELNFKSIYHLEGGMKAWEKAGKKVEK
jgi:phage shock protein E